MALPPELSRGYKQLGLSIVMTLSLGSLCLYDAPPSHSQIVKVTEAQHLGKTSIASATTEATTSSTAAATTTTTEAPTTTTTVAPTTTVALTPGQVALSQVTAVDYQEWSKVNICEESGNWHVSGSIYSGGLGISHTNWVAYNGQAWYGDEASATPYQQIAIAKRIQSSPPDQSGCGGGW